MKFKKLSLIMMLLFPISIVGMEKTLDKELVKLLYEPNSIFRNKESWEEVCKIALKFNNKDKIKRILQTIEKQFKGLERVAAINEIALSQDGRWLITAIDNWNTQRRNIYLWDLKQKNSRGELLKSDSEITSDCFFFLSADSKCIVNISNSILCLWSIIQDKPTKLVQINVEKSRSYEVRFSSDNAYLGVLFQPDITLMFMPWTLITYLASNFFSGPRDIYGMRGFNNAAQEEHHRGTRIIFFNIPKIIRDLQKFSLASYYSQDGIEYIKDNSLLHSLEFSSNNETTYMTAKSESFHILKWDCSQTPLKNIPL